MRARFNNRDGNLFIGRTQVLHYMEGGRVRKFYQVMAVEFTDDNPAVKNGPYYSVFNWGAGEENGPLEDFKGGIKYQAHHSAAEAASVNAEQIWAKQCGGYIGASDFDWTAKSGRLPAKLIHELGMTQIRTPSAWPAPPVSTVTERTSEFKVQKKVPACRLDTLDIEVTDLSTLVLQALAAGDLTGAITGRQRLVTLINEMRGVQEKAEGQLEVLNAKLTALLM